MRISDWSSDVCSSDLAGARDRGARGLSVRRAGALCRGSAGGEPRDSSGGRTGERAAGRGAGAARGFDMALQAAPDRLRDRKRVVEGKRGSVTGERRGPRIITQKTQYTTIQPML